MAPLHTLKTTLTAWAASQRDVVAVVLVGSHARGTAREDSDVDLVVLVEDRAARLRDTGWLTAALGAPTTAPQREDYGPVVSLRVWLPGGLEVELSVGGRDWAVLARTDAATQAVLVGAVVWYDPAGLLSRGG